MNEDRPDLIVTGMGAITPLGCGLSAFVSGIRSGRSGVSLLPESMTGRDRIKSKVAALCTEFDPASVMSDSDRRRVPRLVPMALAAVREALHRAGLIGDVDQPGIVFDGSQQVPEEHARRVGLILGTGAGGIDFTLDQARVGYDPASNRQPSLWTITNATHGNLAGELSIHTGLRGPSWCVSTGCASSSDALGMAMESLRGRRPGSPDAFVVVGADAHVRWETLLGMELLRVISTGAFDPAGSTSRPFDRDRDGFVLAEGAWALVLERREFARQRGHSGVARATGYGSTCDAHHRVRPDPEMRESARAMSDALADAALQPADIDVLNYHGTATQLNDAVETRAVKLAFGAHAERLVGHSIKGAIGHPQGASGLASVVATIGSMTGADGGPPFLPATLNLRTPDIETGCDLDYTPNEPIPRRNERHLMVNCLAFGAKNSALVFDVF